MHMRFLIEKPRLRKDEAGNEYETGNRPVLMWNNGLYMTSDEVREVLGFKSFVIRKYNLRRNATAVEEFIQRQIHDFGLPDRLHREIGRGKHKDDEDSERPDFFVDVYITFCKKDILTKEYNRRRIIVIV